LRLAVAPEPFLAGRHTEANALLSVVLGLFYAKLLQLRDSRLRTLYGVFMGLNQPIKILSGIGAACLWCAGLVHGQTASSVNGLYYTGMNPTGTGLQAQGTQDSHWSVTYVSGTGLTAAANEGAGYVLTAAALSGSGYVANTSSAQWITAPGAATSAT